MSYDSVLMDAIEQWATAQELFAHMYSIYYI